MIYGILFTFMGGLYFLIEVLYRGYSHWTMIIVGGICGILIGLLNEYKLRWSDSLVKQVFLGLCIVLPIEFISGCVINVWFGLDVWDYSHLPLNLLGQTSLTFAPVFIPCILLAILLDDFWRWKFNGERWPKYHII